MCTPLNRQSKLGSFGLTGASNESCERDAVALGHHVFFGNGHDGKPLFVAMDYEQFMLARNGMYLSWAVGGVLLIATIGLGIAYARKK